MKIIAFALLSVLFACSESSTRQKAKDLAGNDDSTYVPVVKTLTVKPEDIQSYIDSYGNINYVRKADITVLVAGTYEQLLYEEGDQVRAGAAVARLSNIALEIQRDKAQSDVQSAVARYELAQVQYEQGKTNMETRFLGLEKSSLELLQKQRELDELIRTVEDQKTLFEAGGITESAMRSAELSLLSAQTQFETLEKDLDIQMVGMRDEDIIAGGYTIPKDREQRKKILIELNIRTLKAQADVAKANLDSVRTDLSSVQTLLEKLTLHSPIDGVVGVRGPEVGENAAPGDSVYVIFETKHTHIVFPVQESQAVLMRPNMTVDVTIDAYPGQLFYARVDRISPLVDPTSGNVTVRALLDPTDFSLKPGMFARVRVKTSSPRKAVMLPVSVFAEKKDDNGSVFTVRRGKVFLQKVKLGVQIDNRIEVIDGLSKGQVVIDEPSPILQEGQEVKVEA